jgi:hypothetical protein
MQTTVVYGSTNEVATYLNGSLSQLRVINGMRSHRAAISFLLKFPFNADYKTLEVFKKSIEEYIKCRPREWSSFGYCRPLQVEADLCLVVYKIFVLHREAWQNSAAVLQSKADLQSFAFELSKKMNLNYQAPPLPVNLTMTNGAAIEQQLHSNQSQI